MTQAIPSSTTLTSKSYAALRHGGAPPWLARAQLGLKPRVATRLETLFLARRDGGHDPMRPRFARHAAHVAAVMQQGGFPVLPERRR
jgi:hypothetical protein